MKWRYKEIKKTFKNTIKEKALNASKITRYNFQPLNVYRPIPSGPPSKVSSFTNLNKEKVYKASNLLVVSKTTIPR